MGSLVHPGENKPSEKDLVPDRAPRRLDRRAFDARVRAELHQVVQALARGDYEGAAACLSEGEGAWDAARFEEALAPVLATIETIRVDPEARRGHWTRIDAESDLSFSITQTLIDEEGEGGATIEARVDLEAPQMPPGPMLRLVAISG